MAIPPTIPTSFVPKQPVSPSARQKRTGLNILLIAGVGIFVLSLVAAGAVFGYQKYLEGVKTARANELIEAERKINPDTVESFIRLRNRLLSAQTLLDEHIAFSQFFSVLEVRTLQTVRFNTLTVTLSEDRSAEIEMEGVARSFNALAAQSASFATEPRIKRAIFSGISVNDNGTVAFTLTAELDSRLIIQSEAPPPVVQEQQPAAATTTATTSQTL